MKSLSDKTLVPVGLAVIVIGTGSFAVAGILNKQTINSEAVQEIRIEQKEIRAELKETRKEYGALLVEMAEMKGLLKRAIRDK